MRIIFLDFDGVLNADTAEADESSELWTASWLDTVMVGRLARLVESTGASIVISSSWRQRRSQAELSHTRPPEGDRLCAPPGLPPIPT